uniref:Putative secreted protein n=1 Tax=Anopheles darlingi TaxID=43151 RepID=A0A2M4DC71_ANODA
MQHNTASRGVWYGLLLLCFSVVAPYVRTYGYRASRVAALLRIGKLGFLVEFRFLFSLLFCIHPGTVSVSNAHVTANIVASSSSNFQELLATVQG